MTVCDNHRTEATCDFPDDDRLIRTGHTFDGWNTAANGSGTAYAPTNRFAISGNTILYAQWKALPAPTSPGQSAPAGPISPAGPSTPAAAPALRATRPKVTATGAMVTFTAPGAGTATARGSTSQGIRAGVTVCRGTTKVRKAGKATVTCVLNATGRRLRAKGSLAVTVTTVFAARGGAQLQATSAVVLPRRG